MKDWLRRLFYAWAPQVVQNARVRAVLVANARALAARAGNVTDPESLWRLLAEYPVFSALQREWEIVRLLRAVRDLQPTRLCEIGTANGGTSFLLARVAPPGSILVTADLSPRPGRAEALAILGAPRCAIRQVHGDSRADATERVIRAAAGGEPFDFLLIDGDHGYNGVAADFERYRKLVRRGGIIALHDIVQDTRRRSGVQGPGDAGDVPRFWRELVSRFPGATSEIVENPDQDACGIGIVIKGEMGDERQETRDE